MCVLDFDHKNHRLLFMKNVKTVKRRWMESDFNTCDSSEASWIKRSDKSIGKSLNSNRKCWLTHT